VVVGDALPAVEAAYERAMIGEVESLRRHIPHGDLCIQGDMVEFANRLAARITRPIQLIHMPVPRNRCDEGYFRPLERLAKRPETVLCLGLVHYTDGVAGTRERFNTARKFVPDFSIATECGFGRRDPSTLTELLRIHAEIAADP
jgi:hypothetical protein